MGKQDVRLILWGGDTFAREIGIYFLVSFKSVDMNHSEQSFTFERRSWLFLKGDISKKIPPGLAVAKYVGFTPRKPWESPSGSSKPHIFGHLPWGQ